MPTTCRSCFLWIESRRGLPPPYRSSAKIVAYLIVRLRCSMRGEFLRLKKKFPCYPAFRLPQAPTGSGKTLAFMIPALIVAEEVTSCYTTRSKIKYIEIPAHSLLFCRRQRAGNVERQPSNLQTNAGLWPNRTENKPPQMGHGRLLDSLDIQTILVLRYGPRCLWSCRRESWPLR